ncbi:MAG: U32 family peptidase [Isosphaeraceae bacterium]
MYRLGQLEVRVVGTSLVPKSQLNALRRRLVEPLGRLARRTQGRRLATESVVSAHLASIAAIRDAETSSPETTPELAVLCRTLDQIEAALLSGIRLIYADFQDIKAYGEAVGTARAGGAAIFIASPRIEKPFEGNLFRFLAKQNADGLLIRNAGGLEFCHKQGIPFVADFSLNAANPLTVELLIQRGARRVTASYDLNVGQLLDLLATTPSEWLEIVIHQQIPMFHMEHCVYCAFLSPGTDKTNCGRPCDHHDVKLRDRVGMDHPLKADVGCRNTLFNAVAQSAAEHIPRLLDRRARHFRIEFLDDDAESVRRTIELYREGLSGQRDVKTLWRALRASNQYGVTRGALTVL